MIDGNLHELPDGWVWTTLGEIAEINPKLPENNILEDLEVSFLPMKAIEELTGRFDLSITREYGNVKKGYTPFVDRDIIFAKITPCMENGKVAFVHGLTNGIGFGSTEFHVIRLPECLSEKFFFFFLIRGDFRKDARANMTGSAGQLRVPSNYMKNVLIPLPSFSEQQRIVTKIEQLFTELDAGIEALKKVKTQLRRYRQAVLKYAFEGNLTEEWRKMHKEELEPASVLLERIREERKKNAKGKYKELPPVDVSDLPELPDGWVWTKLGEIAEKITKGATPTSYGFKYVDVGIGFIKVENIVDDNIDSSKLNHITIVTHRFLERSQLRENDILFSIAGTIGRSAIVRIHHLPANTNQALAIIRLPQDLIMVDYIHLYLTSHVASLNAQNEMRGVGMNNISLGDVNNIAVSLPPFSEQQKIVEEIEQKLSVADEMKNIVEQTIKQAERLRQSILKRAFEGKLVPQNPSDEPANLLLERIKAEKAKKEPRKTQKTKKKPEKYEQKRLIEYGN